MTQLIRFAAVIAASALAVPAFAYAPDAAPANGTAAKPDSEKQICRRETATGSIMPKRVCKTRAEWSALSEAGEAASDKMRDRQRTVKPGDL